MNMKGFLGGWALVGMGLLGCGGGTTGPPEIPLSPPTVSIQAGPALHFPRYLHAAVTLSDGRTAVLGGADPYGTAVPSCEVFTADGSNVVANGALLYPRISPAALLLVDGKVVVMGGMLDNHGAVATQIEVWDPNSGISLLVGNLQTLHGDGLSTVFLPDGKILVFGGVGWGEPELVDPNAWVTEVLSFPGPSRFGAAVATVTNGNVSLAGGGNGSMAFDDRWLYDWRTKAFTPITGVDGTLAQARVRPGSALMKDGRWVLLGGDAGPASSGTVETYLTADGPRLALTQGALNYAMGTTTLLADDRVLMVGGAQVSGLSTISLPFTRIYGPTSGRMWEGQHLLVGRSAHTATLLSDGRVLIVGGSTGLGALASTEILTVH